MDRSLTILLLKPEGRFSDKAFSFAGTCHPYLPRRGLGKWELFEWVPCLNNSYLRPATASWWLSVPVLWADAKTSWHDEAWVITVWWQNTRKLRCQYSPALVHLSVCLINFHPILCMSIMFLTFQQKTQFLKTVLLLFHWIYIFSIHKMPKNANNFYLMTFMSLKQGSLFIQVSNENKNKILNKTLSHSF